jgi:hypothetical protein
MRRLLLLPLVLPALATSPAALAAPCDLTGYIVSPDLLTYSVPGLGLAAFENAPAGCTLAMPIKGVTSDTISLFSASYGGELSEGTGARLTVQHNGVTETTDLVGEPGGTFSDALATGTVFARGDTLQSSFTAEVTNAVGSDEFDFDSADYVLMSRANLFDLSIARTGLVTQLSGTAELLSGAGQPQDESDSISALGGVGSITLGVTARRSLDGGISVRGGVAYLSQDSPGASTSGLLFSGSVRYTQTKGGQLYRPYFEVGALTGPALGTTLGLVYTTLTTTVLTSASTTASFNGGYVEGGVLVTPSSDDTIVLSGRLSTDVLSTGRFTTSGSGVFSVTQPAQSVLFGVARAGIDYTHRLNQDASVTLTGAAGGTLGASPTTSSIAGAGSFNTAPASELFAQYGARVNYLVHGSTDLSGFVFGSTGQLSGTHLQVGAGAKVQF